MNTIETINAQIAANFGEMLHGLITTLESPETAAKVQEAAKEARTKYKPLGDWRTANKDKPRNLKEAVIRRKTFRTAYEQVYGPGSYEAE